MSKIDDLKKNVADNRNWRSEQASTSARNLALGVLALVWGVTALGQATSLFQGPTQFRLLICSGVAALLALAADWLQAIVGYANANRAFDRVYSSGFSPDRDDAYPLDWTYRVSQGAFFTKQIAAPLAAVMLLISVVPTMGASMVLKADSAQKANNSATGPLPANNPQLLPQTQKQQ